MKIRRRGKVENEGLGLFFRQILIPEEAMEIAPDPSISSFTTNLSFSSSSSSSSSCYSYYSGDCDTRSSTPSVGIDVDDSKFEELRRATELNAEYQTLLKEQLRLVESTLLRNHDYQKRIHLLMISQRGGGGTSSPGVPLKSSLSIIASSSPSSSLVPASSSFAIPTFFTDSEGSHPPENLEARNIRLRYNRVPSSIDFDARNWGKLETDTLLNGVKQKIQEMMTSRLMELCQRRGSENMYQGR
jgi:hypothetical protein